MSQKTAVGGPDGSGPKRVLLVEDHVDTLALMQRLLKMWGHTVQPARNIREALAAADGCSFDVLMSDLSLPDGDGWQLVEQLRRTCEPFCAIAVSGHAMKQHISRSAEAGFDFHINKPIDTERLRQILERCAEPQGREWSKTA